MGHIVEDNYWLYDPVKEASIVFAILFAASGLIHGYQNGKHKAWCIGFPLPWGATNFVIGFIVREVGAYQHNNIGAFICSNVMMFIAPPLYTAANHLILGRTLHYVRYNSPSHPGRVVAAFIILDMVVEGLTGNGISYVTNQGSADKIRVGGGLTKAALLLQLALYLVFVGILFIFHHRCISTGTLRPHVRTVITVLYMSSALFLIRTLFRTVQSFCAYRSTISTTEAYFWIFDATPMLLNSLMLNVFPPARYLPSTSRICLSRDGRTEVESPGHGCCG